jgi:hypothetical protein
MKIDIITFSKDKIKVAEHDLVYGESKVDKGNLYISVKYNYKQKPEMNVVLNLQLIDEHHHSLVSGMQTLLRLVSEKYPYPTILICEEEMYFAILSAPEVGSEFEASVE